MGMATIFECLQKDEVDLFVVVCGNDRYPDIGCQ